MPHPQWWTNATRRLSASLARRGVAGTLRLVPAVVRASLRGDPERRFDRRFNVDTAGIVKPLELQSDPRFRHSNWYGPTAEATFRRMLAQIKVDFREFVFVDLGCGKGKALLLASRLPFKQIVGVELWPEMCAIAEENLKRYSGKRKCTNFRLHCVDAAQYPFPDDPGIYYFFDPFQDPVLAVVLANLKRSVEAVPRAAYVVYCEPGKTGLLDASGFLTLLRRTPHYAIYKAGRG